MAETKITVLVSETLRRRAKAAAALRGETLSDVVRTKLEQYVMETEGSGKDPEELLRTEWSNVDKLAEEIGASWPKDVTAADAIREDRREL